MERLVETCEQEIEEKTPNTATVNKNILKTQSSISLFFR